MIPEEKLEVITEFINYAINNIDAEILYILESNFNRGDDLLKEYEKVSVEHMLHAKDVLNEYLVEDGKLYDYVYEED